MTDLKHPQMPSTIDRAHLLEAVQVLGIDPYKARSVYIESGQITVEAFLVNEEGVRVLHEDGNGFQKHIHTIRVVDDEGA